MFEMRHQVSACALALVSALIWGGFTALLVLQCLPFFLIRVPPLTDYPNHLARIYILGVGATDRFLSQYYMPAWDLLPNLGFDIPTLLFFRVLPIYAAGKPTLILTILLLSTGVVAVNTALWGRPRLFVLVDSSLSTQSCSPWASWRCSSASGWRYMASPFGYAYAPGARL
jgi:hypothetical protein